MGEGSYQAWNEEGECRGLAELLIRANQQNPLDLKSQGELKRTSKREWVVLVDRRADESSGRTPREHLAQRRRSVDVHSMSRPGWWLSQLTHPASGAVFGYNYADSHINNTGPQIG